MRILSLAVHANEDDPILLEQQAETAVGGGFHEGQKSGHLRGPNVDLTLSVKGRKFMNSTGTHNMPDGEIYTGPVEDSVNGWVKFTYPANYGGTSVEGAELTFSNGRVEQAKAEKNEDFCSKCSSDDGSRYLGEFAIGTNFDISNSRAISCSTRRSADRSTWRSARATRKRVRKNKIRHPLGHDLRYAHGFGDPCGRRVVL
jgi:hypothetical protein